MKRKAPKHKSKESTKIIIKRKNSDKPPAKKIKQNELNADDILTASLNAKNKKSKYGPQRLKDSFFDLPAEELAKEILGKILVRRLEDGTILKGRIIETECYPGGEDKASISYNGRITEKFKAVYMKPGTTFVYMTYGMYHCMNISSQGRGSAILLRALEPLEGLEYMLEERKKKKSTASKAKDLQPHELCNGPAKLCMGLNITKEICNEQDLTVWDGMWIEEDKTAQNSQYQIIATSRIGIDSVGSQWASKPFRFYILGSTSVSKKDVNKEREFLKKT